MIETCANCIHDGQCDGLPFCGGSSFQSVWVKCDRCGGVIECFDGEENEDGDFLCFRCLEEESHGETA